MVSLKGLWGKVDKTDRALINAKRAGKITAGQEKDAHAELKNKVEKVDESVASLAKAKHDVKMSTKKLDISTKSINKELRDK